MPVTSIRVVAVVSIIVLTIAYLFSLVVLTYVMCFMQSVGCIGGWTARTIATFVYLGLVAAVIYSSRWLLMVIAQRAAVRRDGMM